jgi:hypothetical protein
MRAKVATILATGAAFAFLGGCGGDDAPIQTISTTGSDSTAATAPTQDEFISGADSRCAEANSAIGSLSSTTDASTAVSQQLSITQEVLTGIQALGTPDDDSSGDLAAFYKGLKSQISILKQQQTALSSGDTATSDALSAQLDQAESDTQTAATSYGMDACGSPPEAVTPSSGGSATTPGVTPAPTATTSTTPAAPVEPAPEPTPAPTGGTGAGTPTPAPTPTPTPDPGTSGGSGGLSP